MTQNDLQPTQNPTPSRSRMRYVEARLQADADAVLREIAYVLKLTCCALSDDILCEQPHGDGWRLERVSLASRERKRPECSVAPTRSLTPARQANGESAAHR